MYRPCLMCEASGMGTEFKGNNNNEGNIPCKGGVESKMEKTQSWWKDVNSPKEFTLDNGKKLRQTTLEEWK